MFMFRVPFDEVAFTLTRILRKAGFDPARAALCAQLFAETTRDGVYTHGLNRFPRFLEMIRNGSVDAAAHAECVAQSGSFERWNGNRGPGNLNAYATMARAIELARTHGVGVVALANTNHWMRGGTYGWQAADAGLIGICWTNTLPNLPPWGGLDPTVGNNPLVIGVPRANGNVVLDMAMSQFSYGTLAGYAARGEQLPFVGGFDAKGELTRDPAAIDASQRALPIGYWKGSGLSLMLDLMAARLSGGQGTFQIPQDPVRETGLSQVFCAFDTSRFGDEQQDQKTADAIISFLQSSRPASEGEQVRYPGEQTLKTRAENMALGLPVDPELWARLQTAAKSPDAEHKS